MFQTLRNWNNNKKLNLFCKFYLFFTEYICQIFPFKFFNHFFIFIFFHNFLKYFCGKNRVSKIKHMRESKELNKIIYICFLIDNHLFSFSCISWSCNSTFSKSISKSTTYSFKISHSSSTSSFSSNRFHWPIMSVNFCCWICTCCASSSLNMKSSFPASSAKGVNLCMPLHAKMIYD